MRTWLTNLGTADRATIAIAIAWTVICAGPAHSRLVHLVHPAAAGIGLVWLACLALELGRAARARHALDRMSFSATIANVTCRVLPGDGGAFALGGLRPSIYVGANAVNRLGRDELTAVMLHEEHHRRTFAPLRSAAIAAWLRMFRWVPFAAASSENRLAQIEVRADNWALAHGVGAGAIARAILKCPPGAPVPALTSMSGGGEVRVRWLTAASNGSLRSFTALPMELAPIAFVVLPLIACYLLGAGS